MVNTKLHNPHSAIRTPQSFSPGITLIEIMVVMGIMIILASLTTGAAFALINRSNNKGAENLLEQIANGLEAYSLDHAMFVPVDLPYSTTSPISPNSRPLWYALEHDGGYIEVISKFKQADEAVLSDPLNDDQNLTHFVYQDPWKTEIHYVCSQTDGFRTATITSAGRDKQIGTDDDIIKEVVKGLE